MANEQVKFNINVGGSAEANLKKINAQFSKLNAQQSKYGKNAAVSTKSASASFSKMAVSIGSVIAATVALGKAASSTLGKFMDFEKAQAVLSNTFGSNTIATQELDRLEAFAAKTPFQLESLTQSYIKLVNRGFNPTNKELRSLGDLASSTGKDFDQLTEAVLDAQTGEFERLKDFGIKAKKEGDKITFTFKGQKTEVKNTEDAIKSYILALGEMKGVGGSMSAINKTLDGQQSNLQDNFDKTSRIIGEKLAPSYSLIIDYLNKYNEESQILVSRNQETINAVTKTFADILKYIDTFKTALTNIAKSDFAKTIFSPIIFYVKSTLKYMGWLTDLLDKFNKYMETDAEKRSKKYFEQIKKISEIEDIDKRRKAYKEELKDIEKIRNANLARIKELQKNENILNKDQKKELKSKKELAEEYNTEAFEVTQNILKLAKIDQGATSTTGTIENTLTGSSPDTINKITNQAPTIYNINVGNGINIENQDVSTEIDVKNLNRQLTFLFNNMMSNLVLAK